MARYADVLVSPITPPFPQFRGTAGIGASALVEPAGCRAKGYTHRPALAAIHSCADLRMWSDIPLRRVRQRLVARVRPLLLDDEDIDIRTGLEFWFTPPRRADGTQSPTSSSSSRCRVIFPLTMIVPWLLRPLFAWLPVLTTPGVQHLIVAALIVGAVTWLVMPHYTRLVSRWLYG